MHKDRTVVDLAVRHPLRPHRAPLQGARARAGRWPTRPRAPWPEEVRRASSRWRPWSRTTRTRPRWRQAIYEELENASPDEPVPAEELQKMKNQAKANAYRRLSSPFFIALQLLYLRRARATGVHQLLRRRSRPRDRRRHPARGPGDLHQGEPHRRRLPAQGGRGRGSGRSGDRGPARRRRRPWPASSSREIAAETDAAKLREGHRADDGGAGAGAAGDEAGARPASLKRAQERLAALEGGQK